MRRTYRTMRLITAGLIVTLLTQPCCGWWECGHHIIAVIAFDLLNDDEQQQMLEILAAHPRYKQDFTPPNSITDPDHWRIGTAGYWPDIARRQPAYNRPTWHYQLGATLTLGEAKLVNVPKEPGPLPDGATLETQELHIAQATELCRRVFSAQDSSISDRAIALTWLAHLVGDAHQPCHAGSLYANRLFPNGDRGANSIPVQQKRNLHALWDSLLGDRYDAGDIRRRIREITDDTGLMEQAQTAASIPDGLDPLTWLQESREQALRHVYTPEVLNPITAASRGFVKKIEGIDLSEQYLKEAGALSRIRAAKAAHRLAAIWRNGLNQSTLAP